PQTISETDEAWMMSDSTTSNSSSSVGSSTNRSSSSADNTGLVNGWTNKNRETTSLDASPQASSSASAVVTSPSLANDRSPSTYSSSSKGSGSVAAPSNKLGVIEWEHPTERANGEYLEVDDIAGYELRYSRDNEDYKTIIIPGSRTTLYKIPAIIAGIKGIKVEIAVFDTDGLYSEFVNISPSLN